MNVMIAQLYFFLLSVVLAFQMINPALAISGNNPSKMNAPTYGEYVSASNEDGTGKRFASDYAALVIDILRMTGPRLSGICLPKYQSWEIEVSTADTAIQIGMNLIVQEMAKRGYSAKEAREYANTTQLAQIIADALRHTNGCPNGKH